MSTPDIETEIGGAVDRSWILLTTGIVLTMQISFALLESGGTRKKNRGGVWVRTFLNATIWVMTWWLLGYAIGFGGSQDRFIGGKDFFAGDGWDLKGVLTSTQTSSWFSFTVTGMVVSSVVSLSLSERISIIGSAVHTFFMSVFIYPVVNTWTWGEGFLFTRRGFSDYGGSGIVFVTAGFAALAGLIVLGPRYGRDEPGTEEARRHFVANSGDLELFREKAQRDQDESFGVTNATPLLIGGLLLWVQFAFWAGGTSFNMSGTKGWLAAEKAVVNVILAGASAALSGLIFKFWVVGEDEKRTLRNDARAVANSGLTGIIAVLAGCNDYDPWEAVVIGFVAVLFYLLCCSLFEKFKIDDPNEAFQVFGVGGTIGLGLEAFFNHHDGIFHNDPTEGRVLGNQILGWIIIAGWSFFWSFIIWLGLKVTGNLRVSLKTEIVGSDFYEYAEGIAVSTLTLKGKSRTENIYTSSPTKEYAKKNSYLA